MALRRFAGIVLACSLAIAAAKADELVIESFDSTGRLTFNTLADGTNYNYRVEWAPYPGGPWNVFGASGACRLDTIQAEPGSSVTSSVPMCYRVVATLGDYMCIDISGGTNATSYPVTYYRTLADVPGGPNSDAYKTDKLLFRLIPKGVFTMGSPQGEVGRDFGETQHQVTLTKDFYAGVFEVTQKQWERVMGDWPSYFTNAACRDTRPVEQVSYYEIRENADDNTAINPNWPESSAAGASSFVGRLRAKTGLSTLDLPTEAQWERACRGGASTALNSGKNLVWGNSCPNMNEVGRYWFNGGSSANRGVDTDGGTAAVGSYLPNAWGLYDMHGNVWEQCLDWYLMNLGTDPVEDPAGATSGSGRSGRAGSYEFYAAACRAAVRGGGAPSNRSRGSGLRLAIALQ